MGIRNPLPIPLYPLLHKGSRIQVTPSQQGLDPEQPSGAVETDMPLNICPVSPAVKGDNLRMYGKWRNFRKK